MSPSWRTALIRSGLVFLISLVLVVGFWFHREFYQIGLYPLMAIGGFVTFLVIIATSWVLSGGLPARRAKTDLVVSPAEGESIARRETSTLVAPAAESVPRPGMTVRVVTETGASYGTARVVSAFRTLLEDLALDDIRDAGHANVKAFRAMWESSRRWKSEEPVTVLRLMRIGGKAG